MPIQINEGWHKLQGLTDISWFSVSLALVTRLLLDLLESLQTLLFQQQYNSAVTLARLYGTESKVDPPVVTLQCISRWKPALPWRRWMRWGAARGPAS